MDINKENINNLSKEDFDKSFDEHIKTLKGVVISKQDFLMALLQKGIIRLDKFIEFTR